MRIRKGHRDMGMASLEMGGVGLGAEEHKLFYSLWARPFHHLEQTHGGQRRWQTPVYLYK